ncbi:MAG: type II toxin-antitoxin system Phd/YefM family antitoxin [Marmoricola sp.]
MTDVSIRDLRNRGGEIVDRVEAGESVTITRDGRPVAELRPLPRRPMTASALVANHRGLPRMELADLRRDLDEIIDPRLFPE